MLLVTRRIFTKHSYIFIESTEKLHHLLFTFEEIFSYVEILCEDRFSFFIFIFCYICCACIQIYANLITLLSAKRQVLNYHKCKLNNYYGTEEVTIMKINMNTIFDRTLSRLTMGVISF